MSHYIHTAPRFPHQLVALGALLAVAAVVLALAVAGGAPTRATVDAPTAALRSDGGPEESGVAAGLRAPAVARPDESRIGAAIAPAHSSERPDESAIASALR